MLDLSQPFLARALATGIGLAVIAAPLGCVVVWRRMAYVGETLAQASLLGVALGLALNINLMLAVMLAAVAAALLLTRIGRQKLLSLDTGLGLMHHAALALAVIAIAMLKGPGIDLMSYLFGDILSVTAPDLAWVYGGGALVLALMLYLWKPLVLTSLHEDIAKAEGVDTARVNGLFDVMLALTIAVAMKVCGALLAMAFLVVPAAAARPIAHSPERMALLAAVFAIAGVIGGLMLSASYDTPAGPSIVLIMSALAAFSLLVAGRIRR